MPLKSSTEVEVRLLSRSVSVSVPLEEQGALRSAIGLLQTKLEGFRQVYTTQDDATLFLMCCVDLATEAVHQRLELDSTAHGLVRQLQHLQAQAQQALQASTALNTTSYGPGVS